MSAFGEAYGNTHIKALIEGSEYAKQFFSTETYLREAKRDKELMDTLILDTEAVDTIRTTESLRALFNKNRIRLLAPGDVAWTVPQDWPTDFIHVQLVGGGGAPNCGEYKQFTLSVTPGDVISGSITVNGDTVFGGVTAAAGAGAEQTGAFLVKASDGSRTGNSVGVGVGGFEGGQGSSSSNGASGGTGDLTLGVCEGTGASNGENGGGAGYDMSKYNHGGGGGGYGGGGAAYGGSSAGGGSGAVVITCPNGYIPDFVVYNTVDGVTEWRRDENVFNDFGETA